MKQLQPHPWESLDPNLKVGDKVKGKVVVLADYGAFIEIAPGVEGLIHVSEMSWTQHVKNPSEMFSLGDEITEIGCQETGLPEARLEGERAEAGGTAANCAAIFQRQGTDNAPECCSRHAGSRYRGCQLQ
jgi:hypothetical protein